MNERDKELNALSEELAGVVESCPEPIRLALTRIIGRIIAALLSDRRVMYIMESEIRDAVKSMARHDRALFGDRDNQERHPGLTVQLAEMKRTSDGNRKILWGVLGGVLTTLATLLLKWVVAGGMKIP